MKMIHEEKNNDSKRCPWNVCMEISHLTSTDNILMSIVKFFHSGTPEWFTWEFKWRDHVLKTDAW